MTRTIKIPVDKKTMAKARRLARGAKSQSRLVDQCRALERTYKGSPLEAEWLKQFEARAVEDEQ